MKERALCFIYEDYNSPYKDLLIAGVLYLHVSRMRTMAFETFRIDNKLAPVYLSDLVHIYNFKYSFRYNNIIMSKQHGMLKNHIYYFQWNSLLDHFRTENIFFQFKRLLQSWPGMVQMSPFYM